MFFDISSFVRVPSKFISKVTKICLWDEKIILSHISTFLLGSAAQIGHPLTCPNYIIGLSIDWNISIAVPLYLWLRLFQIPSLNDVASHDLQSGALVRFRCMIQDMFDPEFFLSRFTIQQKANGDRRMCCGLFRDIISSEVFSAIPYPFTCINLWMYYGVRKLYN